MQTAAHYETVYTLDQFSYSHFNDVQLRSFNIFCPYNVVLSVIWFLIMLLDFFVNLTVFCQYVELPMTINQILTF